MANDDKMRVKASAEGVEVEVAGGATERIGSSIADALSPFTEVLGALGDEVRRFRIHREEKALATLIKAKDIREKRGIEARTVSPKLLAPWLEGASLEDDSEQNISDIWATLLAEAPSEFSADYAVLISTLALLGRKEADALEAFVPDHFHEPIGAGIPGEMDGVYGEWIEDLFEPLRKSFDYSKSNAVDQLFELFNDRQKDHRSLNGHPVRATFAYVTKVREGGGGAATLQNSKFSHEHGKALKVLERVGLLTSHSLEFSDEEIGVGGYIVLYELSDLGRRLLRIIHPVYTKGQIISRDEKGVETVEERTIRRT